MSFVVINKDVDNLSRLVYLDKKIDNNIESLVYKLDSEFCLDRHVIYLYNTQYKDLNTFVTSLDQYMNRTKVVKKAYSEDKIYKRGNMFNFVRNFRGFYELTDKLDEYTVGYFTISKDDIMEHFGVKKINTNITIKCMKMMQDRLNTLNRDYVVNINN